MWHRWTRRSDALRSDALLDNVFVDCDVWLHFCVMVFVVTVFRYFGILVQYDYFGILVQYDYRYNTYWYRYRYQYFVVNLYQHEAKEGAS